MDPIRDINLNVMQTGTVDGFSKGIKPAIIEKMATQLREAIAVLKGSRAANSVNHRVRTVAIVEGAGEDLIYVPGVTNVKPTKRGLLLTVAHPTVGKSLTRLVDAKSAQVIRY